MNIVKFFLVYIVSFYSHLRHSRFNFREAEFSSCPRKVIKVQNNPVINTSILSALFTFFASWVKIHCTGSGILHSIKAVLTTPVVDHLAWFWWVSSAHLWPTSARVSLCVVSYYFPAANIKLSYFCTDGTTKTR